jgi:hypothetical protein
MSQAGYASLHWNKFCVRDLNLRGVTGCDMDECKDLKRIDREETFKRRALDLDRVELIALALKAFAQPVPTYEPRLDPRFVKVLGRRSER